MIISRTPFRVSFVGGGTDLKSYYTINEGRVLSCAIDKYLYVVVKRQLGIVEHKFRVNWSKVEFANEIDEIQHPIVREALRLLDIDFALEITTFSEIPANTGLGSSSTFTVGLLNALHALLGNYVSKSFLANQASQIEIEILNRKIGKQDHYAASYGSLNIYTFKKDHSVTVDPVYANEKTINDLESYMVLFYTTLKRDAAKLLAYQDKKNIDNLDILSKMADLVNPMRDLISSGINCEEFGEILSQGWSLKKSLTPHISTPEIDELFEKAMSSGATGGKLLGAGGGGFLLLAIPPEKKNDVEYSLSNLFSLKVKFDNTGTRITYYDRMGS